MKNIFAFRKGDKFYFGVAFASPMYNFECEITRREFNLMKIFMVNVPSVMDEYYIKSV